MSLILTEKLTLPIHSQLRYSSNFCLQFFLTVYSQATQVNDHSRVTFANIYITVLDINDNIPIFDPRVYEEMVLENITLETELLTVSVSDKDEVSKI